AHEAPDALDEPPGALDAALRPLAVALGGRVGKHEPARAIDAIAVGDDLRRDHVLLRLRHFLGRADRHGRSVRDLADLAVLAALHILGEKPAAFRVLIGFVDDHAL